MSRWQDVCGAKLVPVEDALNVIRPGHTVGIGVNANAPEFLCRALAQKIQEDPNLHWDEWRFSIEG